MHYAATMQSFLACDRFMLAGDAGALGLGDIRLQSALNEPMRAQIELMSATPEELANLPIGVACAEDFRAYGIDRPDYLGPHDSRS